MLTPGPGAYEAKKIIGFDGPKYSVAPIRPRTAKAGPVLRHPAVGQYEVNVLSTRPTTPAYRIGTSKKDSNSIDKFKMIIPGPQKYDPVMTEKNREPKWM